MTSLVRTTEPASEPVSLSEAKAHLRVGVSDDDSLISGLIVAARNAAETYTRRSLITQGWTLWLDQFPASDLDWWDGMREGASAITVRRHIMLPRSPLQSVVSVTTYDDADTGTVMAASQYFVDTAAVPGRLALRNNAVWPVPGRAANGIKIVFTAGYGLASDVPAALRQGMLAHIAMLYQHRGDGQGFSSAASIALPDVSVGLYQPYRVAQLFVH